MTASFADNEIWHVLLASDDMKRMNVDQLDDAFRLSLVDASTLVWKAGMKTWARLGAVAGMDEEPEESITRHVKAPPAPPRPMSRPAPHPPSRAVQSVHTAVTPVFQMEMLMPPVFTPMLHAPDPYVLPKRRVKIPSEVDFRRSSGGVHWGRWLVALLLITGGVLAAYRQNLLRDGARHLGVETKYLNAEQRFTALLSAKAPGPVKNVLSRLALLPGPNAAAALMPPPRAPQPTPVAATPPAQSPTPSVAAAKNEPDVKTVSLDSLPVLAAEPAAPKVAAAAAVVPVMHTRPAVTRDEPKPVAKPSRESARETAKVEKAEKPEPVAKAEPKPKPEPKAKAEPPPPGNESFLKAAIRSAIAADAAKTK